MEGARFKQNFHRYSLSLSFQLSHSSTHDKKSSPLIPLHFQTLAATEINPSFDFHGLTKLPTLFVSRNLSTVALNHEFQDHNKVGFICFDFL